MKLQRAIVILFGNEKGGSGKTTTAIHFAIGLTYSNFRVALIDLDIYQQTSSRYIENRQKTAEQFCINLPTPELYKITEKTGVNLESDEQKNKFIELLNDLDNNYDFIVIDTPGSHTAIGALAHSYADKVITPINDSFLDLDMIGRVNPDELNMILPGVYSAMLFTQKLQKASRFKSRQKNECSTESITDQQNKATAQNEAEIDWIVVRNRLSPLDAINKRNMDRALYSLAKKLGFRIAPGFGDRVIFKELFLTGLTLYDAAISGSKIKITPSVLAARQEMREFMRALKIREIIDSIAKRNTEEQETAKTEEKNGNNKNENNNISIFKSKESDNNKVNNTADIIKITADYQ